MNGRAVAPKEVVAKGIAKWKKHLVGIFLEKKAPTFLVVKEIEKVFKRIDDVDLSSEGEVFFIKCKDPAHKKILLEGEHIFVTG